LSLLKFSTYYNRVYRCSKYSETVNYVWIAERIFLRALKGLTDHSMVSILGAIKAARENFTFTGKRIIYLDDRKKFNKYFNRCLLSFQSVFSNYSIVSAFKSYTYNNITGHVDLIITLDKTYNVMFSFYGQYETTKILDFYVVNNYLYNMANKSTNNLTPR